MLDVIQTFAVVAAILVGVRAVEPAPVVGRTVIKHEDGGAVVELAAPVDGVYALYDINDVKPKVHYTLNKGDRLGFVRRDGVVFAVAGKNEFETAPAFIDGSLRWKLQEAIE